MVSREVKFLLDSWEKMSEQMKMVWKKSKTEQGQSSEASAFLYSFRNPEGQYDWNETHKKEEKVRQHSNLF